MSRSRRPAVGILAGAFALLVMTAIAAPGRSPAPSASSPAVVPTCTAIDPLPATSSPIPDAGVAAASDPPADAAGPLTVYAAASLRNAFEALAPAYAAERGVAPVYSFDASSALRAQIEQGAPADVFVSADLSNVQRLVDAGIARDLVAFACNQLTVIVPVGNPAGITGAADLGRSGITVIAAGPDVPITRYATQLAINLGIADAYAANVVSEEDNVAAVRARIGAGEGDAGIVYVTDALASGDRVERIEIPAEANVAATYAAATVVGTDQPDESAAFLASLSGPTGQAVLASFGFLPAPTAGSTRAVAG